MGHSGVDGDVALREAINAGRAPGLRILAAARKLTARGRYFQSLNPAASEAILKEEFLQVDSPEEAWRAVDENIFYRADVIKVVVDDDGVGITALELKATATLVQRILKSGVKYAAGSPEIRSPISASWNAFDS